MSRKGKFLVLKNSFCTRAKLFGKYTRDFPAKKNTNIIINYEANTSPLNTPSNLASNSSSNSITAKTAIFSPSKKWAVEATGALEKECNEWLRYIVNSRVAPIKIHLDHWLDLNKRVA